MTTPEGIIFANAFSRLLGWTYFLAWSVSFYPQAILNFQRKSVEGLSLDFLCLNVYGFLCYSIFNVAFFSSKEIQRQYAERNGGNENLVRVNDVFFALHALILSSTTLSQTYFYKRSPRQKVAHWAKGFIVVSLLVVIIQIAVIRSSTANFDWIDLLYLLSYIKLIISFLKYLPQAYLNWKRKSTVGWSIHNILLDFTGGSLSILQLVLDASIANDWSGITGDAVKFGLGFLSIAFDLIFITQHYVLYTNHEDYYLEASPEERQGLLS